MTFDVTGVFNAELDAAIAEQQSKGGIPLADWFNAGPRKPSQDVDWWRGNGPALVQKYIDWYEAHPDIEVWITPDGKPAIELDLTVMFGEVPVRCIIDQVLKSGTALIVTDLKSGSIKPENVQQLAIAACCLELEYGIRPKYGTHFLHRQDKPFCKPTELSGYQHSVQFFTEQFRMLDQSVRQGLFIARPGKQCVRCGVASFCPAMGVAS